MKKIKISNIIKVIICVGILFLIIFPFAWLVMSTFKLNKDIVKWPPTFFSGNLYIKKLFPGF